MILAVVFPQEVCTPALPKRKSVSQLSGAFGGASCFRSFPFYIFIHDVFFFSPFMFVSTLTHLNFRCLFVCSVSHRVSGLPALFYLRGWFPGSHRARSAPRGVCSGSRCFVTTLLSSLTLFSLGALSSRAFGSCIKPFFHPASSTLSKVV